MQVTSTVNGDDSPLIDTMTERRGIPVKIRVQPAILRQPDKKKHAGYTPWNGLYFSVEVTTLDEARAFREALQTFFWLMSRDGIDVVRDTLSAALPRTT